MTDVIKRNKGKIYILISAFVYGFTPLLAGVAYKGGTNSITLTFLRAAMTVPLLFVILKSEHKSIYIPSKQIYKVFVLGVIGGTLPISLLYMSYSYIPVGLATTLHFIYPLVIVLVSAFIYHERITPLKFLAVILVTMGIVLFVEIRSKADTIGIILALLSGIFYSFYVIYLDHSGLDKMDYMKLTFYLMITMSASTFIFGLAMHKISFDMNASSWIYSGIISLLATIVATPLFQAGIKYEGSSTAGILSTFEPVTTTVLSAAFLGEKIGIAQSIGGFIIISGLILAEKYG